MAIHFWGLNWLNALFSVLTVMASAVVIIAQSRKISRQQLSQTAQEWQDIASARNERVLMLQKQLAEIQHEMLTLNGRIGFMDRDRDFLMGRNLDLEQKVTWNLKRIFQLEAALRAAKIDVPEETK